MYRFVATSAVLLASTTLAQAGGIDRGVSTTRLLFQQGNYVELGFSAVSPEVSGVLAPGGIASGDMAASYTAWSFGYHNDLNDRLSLTVILDQPYGADVSYPGGTGYPFAGSTAEITTRQVTAALRYELTDRVSVYGGLRALQATGDAYVSTPLFAYELDSESDTGYGYMLGAAYEIPDIALRVALTYYSEVDLDFNGVENPAGAGSLPGTFPLTATAYSVTMPDSILLEAQSGIAADTLLFGSIRWTDWSEFDATPNRYPAGALIDYDDDIWTYTLGVGRRINEQLSVSATMGYEGQVGGFSANLGPTDGIFSLGLGAEYRVGDMTIAGGVQYSWIGDAVTNAGGGFNGVFNDNTAIAAGIRIGYSF